MDFNQLEGPFQVLVPRLRYSAWFPKKVKATKVGAGPRSAIIVWPPGLRFCLSLSTPGDTWGWGPSARTAAASCPGSVHRTCPGFVLRRLGC